MAGKRGGAETTRGPSRAPSLRSCVERRYGEQIAYAVQLASETVKVTVHEPEEAGKLDETYCPLPPPAMPSYPPLTTKGWVPGHVTVAVVPEAA